MQSYTCLLLTSNGCGHCTAFRGDGLINNGKAYMTYDFINSLYEKFTNAKLNLLNIHYENMSGQIQFISDISKFVKTKEGIVQERFFKYNDKARIRVIKSRNGKNREQGVKDVLNNGSQVDWITMLREKIPDQLKNYIFYFPCFLVIKTDDWNQALVNNQYPMVALPNAGLIIKENNVVKLDRSQQSLNARNVEIRQLLTGIANGSIEVKIEEKVIPKTSNKFLIKSYDD